MSPPLTMADVIPSPRPRQPPRPFRIVLMIGITSHPHRAYSHAAKPATPQTRYQGSPKIVPDVPPVKALTAEAASLATLDDAAAVPLAVDPAGGV